MNTIDYLIEVLGRYKYDAPLTYGKLKNVLEVAIEEEMEDLEGMQQRLDETDPWNKL